MVSSLAVSSQFIMGFEARGRDDMAGSTEAWAERRRAPRTSVDIEAELRLDRQPACPGVIRDLSFAGGLFLLARPVDVAAGDGGRLRFALPTFTVALEPRITVTSVRVVDPSLNAAQNTAQSSGRANVPRRQALGLAFAGLDGMQERAIGQACLDWPHHRDREYRWSARCFVRAKDPAHPFARFGRLVLGTPDGAQLRFPSHLTALVEGARVILKVGPAAVQAIVRQVAIDAAGTDLAVDYDGWGRDFFRLEASRATLVPTREPDNGPAES
ncbi:MAG: PilZ domain-containing protein [Chloroflexota bacterium]